MLKKLPFYEVLRNLWHDLKRKQRIASYKRNGREPWSVGYEDYKWRRIARVLKDDTFDLGNIQPGFGFRLDERIIEYPWIMDNLSSRSARLLDAGSTFNYQPVLDSHPVKDKELTIFNYGKNENSFKLKNVNYAYGDLRSLPFENEDFDEIVCQSTLEHIDMDNSMYGHSIPREQVSEGKNFTYMKVVKELERALRTQGLMLFTLPYGIYKNYEFFQQFDSEMVEHITSYLQQQGELEIEYFKYEQTGWTHSTVEGCNNSISFNPHTGEGKGNDGAAHSRAICCIKFIKG